MLVEMIVSQLKRSHDNLDIGYAYRVLMAFALNVGWLVAMYMALLP